MLVLTRKNNEKIILILPNGQEIIITAASCHMYRVRIGIEAPENVEILREELRK